MFDALLRPAIDPILNRIGKTIARAGITANHITLAGALAGLTAGVAIALGQYLPGLALILLSRLLDGLDGAVARATRPTDFGGYLDIVCDYVFYLAVPLGFAFANAPNLPYALILTASFTLTAVSFLAFAAIAGKRGLTTKAHGPKSFFYNTGLAEGFETILAFVLMCLLPDQFSNIALVFAGLCVATVLQRSVIAARLFADAPAANHETPQP
jgi:phosphatidylglycerophosphate synthase